MKFSRRLLAGLLLWGAASFSGATAAEPSRCEAGPPTPDAAAPQVWSGDFDGDGVVDRLWILPPAKAPDGRRGARQEPREAVRDPWSDRLRPFDPAALTLVLASGGTSAAGCRVVQNRRFFATPIWEEGDKPVRVLLRSDPAARAWRQVARGWRGDGILLGTEAGVDVLLYWDGRRLQIAVPSEAP